MKKRAFTITLYIFFSMIVCIPLLAQNSDPRWEKWFDEVVMDKTYVEGFGILEYLLFRVDASAGETNIMKEASFHLSFIKLLEKTDNIVDYNSIRISDNPNLSENVKRLMSKHGANVSVTFIEPNNNGALTVIINMDTSSIIGSSGTRALAPYDFITFNIYKK